MERNNHSRRRDNNDCSFDSVNFSTVARGILLKHHSSSVMSRYVYLCFKIKIIITVIGKHKLKELALVNR